MSAASETGSHPRKILVVLSGLSAGGSERVTSLIVNHWARQGRQVTVVSFDRAEARPFFAMDARVVVRQLGLPSPKGRFASALRSVRRVFALRRVIRETAPDLVLSFLTKVNVMTLLATRGLGIPVIVSERNNPLRQPMDPVWLRLRDRLYPRAACLVAQTDEVVAQLPATMRGKAMVVPNPIVPEAAVTHAPDIKVVGAVGRLVQQKGFDLFLRAASRIASQVPDWTFVIWGEGEERENLVRLSGDLGLAGRVRFPGVSERPQDWLAQTAIFVLSSRYEGFPNVLGEAMASGIPSIAFDCPFGPRSLITSGVDGLLVEPENVDALAIAIARLVSDASLRMQFAEQARSSVRRFAPERVLEQWDDVARSAVSGARASV